MRGNEDISMNQRILIVLGAPNSPEGILSATAKNRLDLCFKIFSENDLILCTGGWGKQFNISDKPHAYYAKKYLLKKGIVESSFSNFALSSNTVDDAVKSKEIISEYNHPRLLVITSDFHLNRAKLIFEEILSEDAISFVGAENNLSEQQLKQAVEHENKSIDHITKNGLYY